MKTQATTVIKADGNTFNKQTTEFDSLVNEFMSKWGLFSNIFLFGELDENKFSFNYTRYGDFWTHDLATTDIIAFENKLINCFERNVKQKEKRFRNKVNYDFGFLTDYIPKCMIKLEIAELQVEKQGIIPTVGIKQNLKTIVFEKGWYHKKQTINLDKTAFNELKLKFKTSNEFIDTKGYFRLPDTLYKDTYKLLQVKMEMLRRVYEHVSEYYQKMRRQLITRFDKPLFIINQADNLYIILLSLLSSNIIKLKEKDGEFDEMNVRERQQLFRQLLFNLNLDDRLISEIVQRITQNSRTISNLFKELEKSLPLSGQ